jgi:sugar/nucleoside kinase (ribokinase family)
MSPRERGHGIVAGGNFILDEVKVIDAYPAEDALATILSECRSNGGAAYNLLTDLARLGAPFPLTAVGLVGEDPAGDFIIADCRRRGIGVRQLRRFAGAPTSYTYVMTARETGRRTFFHQRGANAFLDEEHFDLRVHPARILHLGYLLLLDRLDRRCRGHGTVAARLLARAHAAGLKTSVDVVTTGGTDLQGVVRSALPYVDYCILNEVEAERATGVPIRTPTGVTGAGVQGAAARLLAAGVREWVVIHFPEGAYAASAGGERVDMGSVRIPSRRIAGAAGAGDAFAAGVLYGMHEHATMEEALRYGIAAAAASLTDATCSAGVRPLRECLRLAAKYGQRPSWKGGGEGPAGESGSMARRRHGRPMQA